MLLYVILALACGCSLVAEAKMQNVTVTGITVCNKRRLGKVLVELWEHDTNHFNRPVHSNFPRVQPATGKDLLASNYTNSQGEFRLSGGQHEMTSFWPYIRVSHVCNLPKDKENCKFVVDLVVRNHKIVNGVYHVMADLTYYDDEDLECGSAT